MRALFLVHKLGELVALHHRVVEHRKQRADWARHGRMSTRILPQNSCEQRGATARQPGYKVVANKEKRLVLAALD